MRLSLSRLLVAASVLSLGACATRPPANDPEALAEFQQNNDPAFRPFVTESIGGRRQRGSNGSAIFDQAGTDRYRNITTRPMRLVHQLVKSVVSATMARNASMSSGLVNVQEQLLPAAVVGGRSK